MKTKLILILLSFPLFLMGQSPNVSLSFPFFNKDLDPTQNAKLEQKQRFRRDYSHVAFFYYSTLSWSEWEKGNNTFVININNNGDIQHYKPNGTVEIYRKVSKVEEDYLDNGERYQKMSYLDEEGLKFDIQIFDNSSIGLKMILIDAILQFANP